MNLQLFRKNISDWIGKVFNSLEEKIVFMRGENFEGVGKTS